MLKQSLPWYSGLKLETSNPPKQDQIFHLAALIWQQSLSSKLTYPVAIVVKEPEREERFGTTLQPRIKVLLPKKSIENEAPNCSRRIIIRGRQYFTWLLIDGSIQIGVREAFNLITCDNYCY